MLPGAGRLADAMVPGGQLRGKTPLCLLANQCMPGQAYHAACEEIVAWLLAQRASPDLPQCREKSPLMLAAGSGNADMVQLLLAARASVEPPAGPGLDAVLTCTGKLKGEDVNIGKIFGYLEARGYQVPPRPVAGTEPAWGYGDTHGSSSSAAARWPTQSAAAPAAATPAAAVAAPAAAAAASAGAPAAVSAPAQALPLPPPIDPTIFRQQQQGFRQQQDAGIEQLLAWARQGRAAPAAGAAQGDVGIGHVARAAPGALAGRAGAWSAAARSRVANGASHPDRGRTTAAAAGRGCWRRRPRCGSGSAASPAAALRSPNVGVL